MAQETKRSFVTKLWFHSNLAESFPIVAIDYRNNFIFYDAIKKASEEPAWYFTTKASEKSNEFTVVETPVVQDKTSFINTYAGYSKTNEIVNDEDFESETFTATRDPILSSPLALQEDSSVSPKLDLHFVTNSNTHGRYWQSYFHNLNYMTYMSNVNIQVEFVDINVPNMRILDLAQFTDTKYNRQSTEVSHSGRYFISKLVRSMGSGRRFVTRVQLTREALNEATDHMVEQNSNAEYKNLEYPDKSFEKGFSKLNKIIDTFKDQYSRLQISYPLGKLLFMVPKVRMISDQLSTITGGRIGFDSEGLWIKTGFISNNLDSIVNNELGKTLFGYLKNTGIISNLPSTILSSITSGSVELGSLLNGGSLSIPSLGTFLIHDSSRFSADMFNCWMQNKLKFSDYIAEIDLTSKKIIMSKDYASEFRIGNKFTISNSTLNDGVYTCVNAVFNGISTEISTLESFQSNFSDGILEKIIDTGNDYLNGIMTNIIDHFESTLTESNVSSTTGSPQAPPLSYTLNRVYWGSLPAKKEERFQTVQTFVNNESSAGTKKLYIEDTSDFRAGYKIVIDENGHRREENSIASVDSKTQLTLTNYLTYSHNGRQKDKVDVYNSKGQYVQRPLIEVNDGDIRSLYSDYLLNTNITKKVTCNRNEYIYTAFPSTLQVTGMLINNEPNYEVIKGTVILYTQNNEGVEYTVFRSKNKLYGTYNVSLY